MEQIDLTREERERFKAWLAQESRKDGDRIARLKAQHHEDQSDPVRQLRVRRHAKLTVQKLIEEVGP